MERTTLASVISAHEIADLRRRYGTRAHDATISMPATVASRITWALEVARNEISLLHGDLQRARRDAIG